MKEGCDTMEEYEMSRDEMINFEINHYVNLLKIKKVEQGSNSELDYQIRVQENKLHTFGVNTDDFKF